LSKLRLKSRIIQKFSPNCLIEELLTTEEILLLIEMGKIINLFKNFVFKVQR